MENFSENDFIPLICRRVFMEKISKRGRPAKQRFGEDGLMKTFMGGRLSCDKTNMNHYYAFFAQIELGNGNDDEFSFIIDANGTELIQYKITILTELGRLENPDLIRKVARVICEKELTTKDAIPYIRSFRTGEKPKGEISKLAHAIADTIDDYIFKHSNVDDEMIRSALDIISGIMEKNSKNQ